METYRPRMPEEQIVELRRWHERAALELADVPKQRVEYLGLTLDIPEGVFPPSPVSHLLGNAVITETLSTDRVLDMGTGSGNNALLAARSGAQVVGVDINPVAVQASQINAALNHLDDRTTFLQCDVFAAVKGHFDLIIFDPPFRWFAARNMMELAFADENYQTLTRFMTEVDGYLADGGRLLIFFGTSGDLEYLHELIDETGFECTELATQTLERDGTSVIYVTYRLTKR